MNTKRQIAILGYGKLGQYLTDRLLSSDGDDFGAQLALVWNRSESADARAKLAADKFTTDIEQIIAHPSVDLIVEVCHPSIIRSYGRALAQKCDLMIGSTTALVNDDLRSDLAKISMETGRRLLLARGALWGGDDIRRMAARGQLESVRIKMHFHPRALRFDKQSDDEDNANSEKRISADPDGRKKICAQNESLCRERDTHTNSRLLYEGPARRLCRLAPNNVNTIATAALIGVGFDRTVGALIADGSLADHHRIEVEVIGVKRPNVDSQKQFRVSTLRISPTSSDSAVSSVPTYDSFWQSVIESISANNRFDAAATVAANEQPFFLC